MPHSSSYTTACCHWHNRQRWRRNWWTTQRLRALRTYSSFVSMEICRTSSKDSGSSGRIPFRHLTCYCSSWYTKRTYMEFVERLGVRGWRMKTLEHSLVFQYQSFASLGRQWKKRYFWDGPESRRTLLCCPPLPSLADSKTIGTWYSSRTAFYYVCRNCRLRGWHFGWRPKRDLVCDSEGLPVEQETIGLDLESWGVRLQGLKLVEDFGISLEDCWDAVVVLVEHDSFRGKNKFSYFC